MALHPSSYGIDTIRRHALGLAELARTNDLRVAVPTCGDWTLADLTWHLSEVHDFWRHVIAGRPDARPDSYEPPTRPADDELADFLTERCGRLTELLEGADAGDPAWSWSAAPSDQTVGFTVRRQSHEALIHHIDGILATGATLPAIAPELGADGVDELVRVMISGVPDWATFTPSDATIALEATDTGDRWPLRFGRMTGTSPETGTTYDLGAVEVIDELDDTETETETDSVVRGGAADLDLWLWGRAPTITIGGDAEGATRLRDLVVDATA